MLVKASIASLLSLQATVDIAAAVARSNRHGNIAEPPEPETIDLVRLPLPPAISDYSVGACNVSVNPRRTGCMPVSNGRGFMSGSFLPDGKHVLALIHFVGARLAPEPGSTYNGSQIILVKTDDSTFGNGEKWKCLTCGVPGVPNTMAVNETEHLDYPQAFDDGKRALVGTYILDCGPYELASQDCTPERTRLLPLRWNTAVDGSGPTGSMRELRLHPDNVHLGFSSFTTVGGKLGQLAFYGRLEYNASPTTGLPLAPRYDVVNVNVLLDSTSAGPIVTVGDKVTINHQAISVGELRGFSGPGDEVVYVGYPTESSNIDAYAVSLDTGKVRHLTSHPEYIDPIDGSRDGKWWAIMDTRGTGRQMFLAGMRGIPPLTDLVSSSVTSATRNNGLRRFFVPYVLDAAGDRGSYYGQKINGPGFSELGSGDLNDPQWNGQADPRWSLDATKLVYWEAQTRSPACGGTNPLPCYLSKEQGGRDVRMVMATFPDRAPSPILPVAPRPDFIPWATRYVPGAALPDRPSPEAGTFILEAGKSGSAQVVIDKTADGVLIESVAVTYHNYSDDGELFLNGHENVTASFKTPTFNVINWFSNLTQTGPGVFNTKVTSPDGFHLSIDALINIFDAEGTISTTINGTTYKQPLNGA
ncbi:hypothetical protein ACJ41O_003524 [Fusarium nematophilum]